MSPAKSGYFRQDYIEAPDGAGLYFQVHGEGEPWTWK